MLKVFTDSGEECTKFKCFTEGKNLPQAPIGVRKQQKKTSLYC